MILFLDPSPHFLFLCLALSLLLCFLSFFSLAVSSIIVNQRKNKTIWQKFIDDMNSIILSIIPAYSRCLSKRSNSQKNFIRYIHPESKNQNHAPSNSSAGNSVISSDKIDNEDHNLSLNASRHNHSTTVTQHYQSNSEMVPTNLSTTSEDNIVVPYTSAAYKSILKMNTLDQGDFLE
jgi:hypothetical protein